MIVADSSYPFLDVMWTMFVFFAWVMVVWLVIMLLMDNFRRRDHGGLAKAGWTILLIFAPLLGAIIYMIARPKPADGVYDDYGTDVGYSTTPAD